MLSANELQTMKNVMNLTQLAFGQTLTAAYLHERDASRLQVAK
jgi:hypothetical protein